MTRTTPGPGTAGRWLAAILGIAALVGFVASASAATKDFSMTVAPSNVLGGRTVAVSATLTNLTKTQQLGSANITPPGTYSGVTVTEPLLAPATANVVGGVVQLRELSLRPKTSVKVSMTVNTPCTAGTSTWSVLAKQANDFSGVGNGLTLDLALSSVTTTIGECIACPQGLSCEATLVGPGGLETLVTADPSATFEPDVGTLAISSAAAHNCAGYVERSSDAFLLDAPQNRPKRALLTFSSATRAVTPIDPLEVCYASPTDFTTKGDKTTVFIDGQLNYVGRLPDCLLPLSILTLPPPCVTTRNNTARSIEFGMPTGDPRFNG